MQQWSCRAGNFNFLIVRGDDDRYVASVQATLDGVAGERRTSTYIGNDYFGGSKLPSFATQTEAERACEATYKTLRKAGN
jgi:hypothetical protein